MTICRVLVTPAAALLIVSAACAGDGGQPVACGTPDCCAHCGCQASCQKKVCQVVCDTKKEKKTRWVVKCEEFCAPLPGGFGRCRGECGGQCPACQSGKGCEQGCDGAGCTSCKQKPLVPPKCGRVRTKKTLVKEEYEVEVPVYKCVVVYLCAPCCERGIAEVDPSCGTNRTAPSTPPAPALKPATSMPPAPKPAGA